MMYYKEFGRPDNGLDNSDLMDDATSADEEAVSSDENSAPVFKCARYKLNSKWSNNTVRYRYSKAFQSSKHVNNLVKAMDIWRTVSNNKITFKKIPNSAWNKITWGLGVNYHSLVDAKKDENYNGQSTLGMVPWAVLNFNETAVSRTYLHELGHTLGLIHEHQRPDRDNYININTANIPKGKKSQYSKYLSSSVTLFGSFDFSSIMLYGSSSSEGIVMTKKSDGSVWSAPTELSGKDIEGIRQLYK